jgi:hypothetical protein
MTLDLSSDYDRWADGGRRPLVELQPHETEGHRVDADRAQLHQQAVQLSQAGSVSYEDALVQLSAQAAPADGNTVAGDGEDAYSRDALIGMLERHGYGRAQAEREADRLLELRRLGGLDPAALAERLRREHARSAGHGVLAAAARHGDDTSMRRLLSAGLGDGRHAVDRERLAVHERAVRLSQERGVDYARAVVLADRELAA